MRLTKFTKLAIGLSACLSVSSVMAADPLLADIQQRAIESKHIPLEGDMNPEDIKQALEAFSELNWVRRLPVRDLIMFENKDGSRMLMDSSARIAIRGPIEVFDMWRKRPIKTEADVQRSWLAKLDLFNINRDDLASFRYGVKKKKPDVTVFVDPKGIYNKNVFDAMKTLGEEYSFQVVLTPQLGDDSVYEAINLWCALDRDESLVSLMDGKPSSGTIVETCKKDPIIGSLALASILHIQSLPHLIREDGLQAFGAPKDLKEFLTRDESYLGEVKIDEDKPAK